MFRFSRWEIRAWSEEQPDICVDLNSWQCSDANPSASAKDPLLGMEETYQRSKTINLDFNANSKEKMRRERMRGRVTDWDNSTASDHIMHCSTDQHKLYIYIYIETHKIIQKIQTVQISNELREIHLSYFDMLHFIGLYSMQLVFRLVLDFSCQENSFSYVELSTSQLSSDKSLMYSAVLYLCLLSESFWLQLVMDQNCLWRKRTGTMISRTRRKREQF